MDAVRSMVCMLLMKRSDLHWSMQEQGIQILNHAIAACIEAIEGQKGKLVVKEPPRAVSVNFSSAQRVFICFKHSVKLESFSDFFSGLKGLCFALFAYLMYTLSSVPGSSDLAYCLLGERTR